MLCYLSYFITLIAERNPVLEENSGALRRSTPAPYGTENGNLSCTIATPGTLNLDQRLNFS